MAGKGGGIWTIPCNIYRHVNYYSMSDVSASKGKLRSKVSTAFASVGRGVEAADVSACISHGGLAAHISRAVRREFTFFIAFLSRHRRFLGH